MFRRKSAWPGARRSSLCQNVYYSVLFRHRLTVKQLVIYGTADGLEPFTRWRKRLGDKVTIARVDRRLDRVRAGNYGDYKPVGDGVFELRLFFGPGYRVYFAEDGDTLVLLLSGGDKSTQARDIRAAQDYWQDYKENRGKD